MADKFINNSNNEQNCSFCRLSLLFKNLNTSKTNSLEPTNQISTKVPKV